MRLLQPDPDAALLGLRAMKAVAAAGGEIGPSQYALLQAARQMILHIDADIDTLAPITPEDFAAGFPGEALRAQFVNGMLVVALADGLPAPATAIAVTSFAAALGVDTPTLTDLRRLTEGHMLLFKLDFLRRSQVGDILRDEFTQSGLLGLAKSVLGMRGLVEDKALAARYRAWEHLPADTLGHALWRYFDSNGFGLPGERGGFPEAGMYHDAAHVLGDYPTTPEGEIEVAAFIAGFKQATPIYLILFAVLTFSAGINMRPVAGEVTTGVLGQPGMAARMFAAIERGAQVNTDISDKWDYWPYIELPLEEARRRLNVLPKA